MSHPTRNPSPALNVVNATNAVTAPNRPTGCLRGPQSARAFCAGLIAAALAGCSSPPPPAPKAEPPAKVNGAPKEADLASVTLTEKAEQRLGIRTVLVERRTVARTRTVGGEVMVPAGQSIVTTAPVAGTVLPAGGAIPPAGAVVRRGQVLLRLVALPTSTDVPAARVRLDAAKVRVRRAEQLLKDGAGSQRTLDDAKAELGLAEAQVGAARPRFGEGSREGALSIESPQAGILRSVLVGSGQSVAAGTTLFQVDALGALWVRVPVYVGDLASIDRDKPAQIRGLGETAGMGGGGRPAVPTAAPPSANADAASTDLYYKLDNADGSFRPGQKVAALLALRGGEESLVVPWSAVVHDIHGGAWVYVQAGAHVYARRRVDVRSVVGEDAVLARGPAPGDKVVVTGVAELFGTEFGVGK